MLSVKKIKNKILTTSKSLTGESEDVTDRQAKQAWALHIIVFHASVMREKIHDKHESFYIWANMLLLIMTGL